MTLQEAKDQIAKEYGANSFGFLLGYQQDQLWPAVAELYARSKAQHAFNAGQRRSTVNFETYWKEQTRIKP